eukprot:TRINITY_DN1868_c0_g1_i1.p1 TRINITY_DN1868_c0_g1~~TRINITY_DN1868_c0_g1_i1.p1  ORF type:complete len:126 (+),score=13.37 TRINITY_DN1868_c0_g1_i1:290-667(+)
MINKGPFDGILGFSQGAVLASILCGLLGKSGCGAIKFNFALLFSGFNPSVKEYGEDLFSHIPQGFKSLHVFSQKDALVDPALSLKLSGFFPKDSTHIWQHNGGHYLPTTAEAKQVYHSWFASLEN